MQRELQCAACKVVFTAAMDHGKWPRFCSRACFAAGAVWSDCVECGKPIRNKRKAGSIACSRSCQRAAVERRLARTCAHCGSSFMDHSTDRATVCCSVECQKAYFVGERSAHYKGGRYVDASGYVVVRVGKGQYRREHRIIAEQVIGRPLHRSQVVLHLNGDHADSRPCNLFVYATNSQFKADSHLGVRPTRSNLDPLTYQQPSERGQSADRPQSAFSDERLPTPLIGPWHHGRKAWVDKDPQQKKTRGTPHSTGTNRELL